MLSLSSLDYSAFPESFTGPEAPGGSEPQQFSDPQHGFLTRGRRRNPKEER